MNQAILLEHLTLVKEHIEIGSKNIARERGRNRNLAGQLEGRAREYEEDAEMIRRMVQRHEDPSGATAVATEGSALTNDGDKA
jgi:hypothetical protein